MSGQRSGAKYTMSRTDKTFKNSRHGDSIQVSVYSVEPDVAHGGELYWNTEDRCLHYSKGVNEWQCVDANVSELTSLNSGDCIDGNSLVINSTGPNLLIRQLKAGANVTIDDTDANCLVIDTISSSSPSSSQKLYVSHSYSYLTIDNGNIFCSFTLIEDITNNITVPAVLYGKLTTTDFAIPFLSSPNLSGRYSIRKTDIQNWPAVAPTNPATFQVCMKIWRNQSYNSSNGWLDSVIFEFTRTL